MALQITGVETTQAIQYFGSTFPLCGPPSARVPCADNSLPLIEGKRTVFRAFVSGGTPGGTLGGILVFTDDHGYQGFRVAVPITTPPVPANRTSASHTLNFTLPDHAAQGTIVFTIRAVDTTGGQWISSPPFSVVVAFRCVLLIKVRLLRIHYVGRGMNIAAPSTASFWSATEFLQKTYPVPSPGIQLVADTIADYDGDFTNLSPGGNANPGNKGTTGTILNILDRYVAVEGRPADVYYGAMFAGGNQSGFDGWAVGRLFISSLNGETLAHELGHCLWRWHAPCGNPPQPDGSYPTYGSLASGSIGEVGVDVIEEKIHDPATNRDFMSGCSPRWISPYTYQGLFARIGPCPAPGSRSGSGGGPTFDNPYLTLSIQKLLDRHVIVNLPAFVVPRPIPPRNEEGTFRVELRGRDGRLLVRETFNPAPGESHHELPDTSVVPMAVPWVEEAASLLVFEKDERVIEHAIEPRPPHLDVHFAISDEPLSGTLDIRWEAASEYGEVSALVRYSPDFGDTWFGIPIKRGAKQARIALDSLPGGDMCLVDVFASSGFRTASVRSRPFAVRSSRPSPLIIRPVADVRISEGQPIDLFGVPQAFNDEPGSLVWTSSIDGPLGTGSRVLVGALSVGRHVAELRSGLRGGPVAQTEIVVVARATAQ